MAFRRSQCVIRAVGTPASIPTRYLFPFPVTDHPTTRLLHLHHPAWLSIVRILYLILHLTGASEHPGGRDEGNSLFSHSDAVTGMGEGRNSKAPALKVRQEDVDYGSASLLVPGSSMTFLDS